MTKFRADNPATNRQRDSTSRAEVAFRVPGLCWVDGGRPGRDDPVQLAISHDARHAVEPPDHDGPGRRHPHSPAAPHHREVAMSELDDFLTPTLARQLEAEQGADQRRPGTAAGHVVNPGPGDRVRGGEERHRSRGGARRPSAGWRRGSPTAPTTASSWWPPGPAGTWPTPLATNASPFPWTAARSRRLPCGSPTSTAARTASGRSSTAMPTFPRPVSPFALMHRRSRHHETSATPDPAGGVGPCYGRERSCAACRSPIAEPSSVPALPDAWRSQLALERVNPPRWWALTDSGTSDPASWLIISRTVSLGLP